MKKPWGAAAHALQIRGAAFRLTDSPSMPADAPGHALIAVVDDDPSIGRAVGRLLRAVGYRAVIYASGADSLHALNHCHPACVVADLHTAFDVLIPLTRREPGRIPLIVMTADDDPQTRPDLIAHGATVCLDKPFDDTALLDAINAALQQIEVPSPRG